MLGMLLSLEHRRRRLARKAPPGPLRDFLAVPFPATKRDCGSLRFVALDFETTGLDPNRDEIISVGSVCLSGTRIDLSTARHRIILPSGEIPERSAVIHHITDDRAALGAPLLEVLTELLQLLAGRVLIAHYARIEGQFLRAACQRVFGGGFLIPIVDTYCIARRWLERRNRVYSSNELRLAALRERHNLPRYRAHDALSDALAAAELFVAQLARYEGSARPLKEFLIKG